MLFASTRVEDLPKDKIHPSCCKFHHFHRYHMDKKRNSSHSKPRKYLKFSSNIAVVCIHMVSGRLYISTISHFFSIASEISIIRSYPLDSSPIFLASLCIPSYSLHMIHPPRLRQIFVHVTVKAMAASTGRSNTNSSQTKEAIVPNRLTSSCDDGRNLQKKSEKKHDGSRCGLKKMMCLDVL